MCDCTASPLLASLLMAFYYAVKLLSLCHLAGLEEMNGKRNTERIFKKDWRHQM